MPLNQVRWRTGHWIAVLTTTLATPFGLPRLDAQVTTAAIDVAIRRDGGREVGTLQGCIGGRCRFDGATLAVEELAWLGLAVPATGAPPRVDGDDQLAVLASGEVVRGAIGSISLGIVQVGGRSLDRAAVRWVRFGTTAAGEPALPDGGTHRPASREPNPEPVRPCPADRPLGGEIEYRYDIADRIYQRCSGTARMWFRLHAMPMQWPGPLRNVWQSDAIDYRLVNHGCTDLPDPLGEVCTAPPQAEIRGRVVIGPVGQFGVDLLDAPGGPVSFMPLDPQLGFLTLPDEIRHRARTPVTCVSASGSSTGEWELPVIGLIAPQGTHDCDTDQPGTVCVAPTLCSHASDPEQVRDCSLHPARYAVIPFTGSGRLVWKDNQGTRKVEDVRWNVCCGCGEPPSESPPDFDRVP